MAKTTKNNNTNNPNTDPNKKNSADMYDILKDIRDEIKKQNSSNKSNSSSTSSSSDSGDKKEHKVLKKLYDDSMGSLGTLGTMFGGPILGGVGKVINHYFGKSLKDKIFSGNKKSRANGGASTSKNEASTSKTGTNAKASATTSRSSASEWNKLEKQAAPINNLSKTVNKKLDIIIKLMGGKIKGLGEDSNKKGFWNKIWDSIKDFIPWLMGATGLKKLWDFIRGKNKTPKASKTKEKSPGKGEKASTKGKASKTKAKPKAKKVPKVKPRKIGRGKLGSALSATGLVLGGIGATTVLSDAEEEDSALMTGIDAAANGLWYYEGGKDAVALSKAAKANKDIAQGQAALNVAKTAKQAQQAKNTISAAQAAKTVALTGGKTGLKATLGAAGGGVLSAGITAFDIYQMEQQKKELRAQGNEREARKLAWQQRIKGGLTVAGGVVGGVVGSAGAGVGAVPGAALGTTVGSVAGDGASWLFGKAYDLYYGWKDKRDARRAQAELEKQKMETDKEVANLKNYKVLEMSEQLNVVVQLLSELATSLSASTQSDLDRQYINMIMQGNYISPNPSYPSNSNTSVDMNVINPAGG